MSNKTVQHDAIPHDFVSHAELTGLNEGDLQHLTAIQKSELITFLATGFDGTHNALADLNVDDFQHLTAAQKSDLIALLARTLADSSDVDDLREATNKAIGLVTKPTIADNGVDSLILGPCKVFLCECVAFDDTTFGDVLEVAGATLALPVNGTAYYVYALRTGDTAAYGVTTDPLVVAVPNATLVAGAIRTGTVFHIAPMDALSSGLANKLNQMIIARDGFSILSGLGLSANELDITLDAGKANYGATVIDLTLCNSVIDGIRAYEFTGSGFAFALETLANNTQYNGPTGYVTLNNNRYNVNWIWRGFELQKHLYRVISRDQYSSIAAATASPIPAVPPIITDHGIFVGGIVYEKDNPVPVAFIAPRRSGQTAGMVSLHNDLGGLNAGDFRHLTAAEYATLQQATNPLGTLTTGDTVTLDVANYGSTTATVPDTATITLAATGWRGAGYWDSHALILTLEGAATVQIPVDWIPQGATLTFASAGTVTLVVYSPDGGTTVLYAAGS